MKVLVDKMPEEAKECLFSIYDIEWQRHCLCRKDEAFEWNKACFLEKNEKCPYLAEIK